MHWSSSKNPNTTDSAAVRKGPRAIKSNEERAAGEIFILGSQAE
jgi:hypothetical protein